MVYRILPYRQGSAGAHALANALDGKVLLLNNSRYRHKPRDVVINWGYTGETPLADCCLNPPEVIRKASNKKLFFEAVKANGWQDICPPFFTSGDMIRDEDFPIVCRQTLAGHSGEGIVIANNRDELVPAPLYVRYMKKKREYRIHVGMVSEVGPEGQLYRRATIIGMQEKRRRTDYPSPNWQVRNYQNGFIYARSDVDPPSAVIEHAMLALKATGLDFGAVDVIYNEHEDRAYVLEVNTAPGLEGTTVEEYAKYFRGEL